MTEQLGNLAGKCGIYKFTFSNGHYNVQKYKFRYAVHVDPFIDRLKQIVKL
jgi:hypothetical protein